MSDPNGLLYMQNRYYNPYLCRFINADPSGFSGGLNLYAYANGNPVSYLDPFGLGAAGEGSFSSWLDNNTYDFSPAGQFMSAYQQTQSQMQQFQSFQPDSPNGGGLSSFLNGTPFLGGAKMTAEQVFTGHDLITGESVDGLSWLSVAAIGASLIPLPLEAGAEEFAAKTGTGFINPSEVRFTQDSIGALFKNGQSIDELARTLRGPGGADLARDFEPIRLVDKNGLLWTLDNRRLAAFAAAGQQVPFRMATQAEISAEWTRKFTTTAEQGWGQFITVRPPPGFGQ